MTAGRVRFEGKDITAARPDARVRLGIAQVPEGRQVFGPLSVEDNLLLGAYVRPNHEARPALARVYELFPALAERRKSAAGMLSGGRQQMLAIGRALMAGPRLLLLDEPSMGLAPRLVAEIYAAIRRLREAGTTIFLVDQNARAALAIADRGYVLETGRVRARRRRAPSSRRTTRSSRHPRFVEGRRYQGEAMALTAPVTSAALRARPLQPRDLEAVVGIDAQLAGRTRRAFRAPAARGADASQLHRQFAVDDGAGLAGYVLARKLAGEFGRRRRRFGSR